MTVEMRIATGAVPLAPLTATAHGAPLMADGTLMRRGYYARQATYERLGARYLDREYLDQRGAFQTSDLFREVPGMRATPGPNRTTLLTMRGGCTASIFVDGVHVNRVLIERGVATGVGLAAGRSRSNAGRSFDAPPPAAPSIDMAAISSWTACIFS